MTLFERLISLRTAAGLTPAEAAYKASSTVPGVLITEAQLRHYESGRARPPVEKLLALSTLYKVRYSDLSLTGVPSATVVDDEPAPSPLSVRCPTCRAVEGERCATADGEYLKPSKSHAARKAAALRGVR